MAKDTITITEDHEEKGQRVMADLSTNIGMVNYLQHMKKRRNAFQSAPEFPADVPLQGGQSVGQNAEAPENSARSRTPVSYTYQWQLNGVDIVGQTNRTILLLVGMIGQTLTCIITASSRFGVSVKVTLSLLVLA